MADDLQILNRLFHQQCRSLGQYVSESWPWTHGADREAQDLVQSIVIDERRWAEQLAGMIMERRGQPTMGSYPDAFVHSNLHFVALDYLLERLAEHIENAVRQPRADLLTVANDPPFKRLIEQMVERKVGQVAALRRLAGSRLTANTRS